MDRSWGRSEWSTKRMINSQRQWNTRWQIRTCSKKWFPVLGDLAMKTTKKTHHEENTLLRAWNSTLPIEVIEGKATIQKRIPCNRQMTSLRSESNTKMDSFWYPNSHLLSPHCLCGNTPFQSSDSLMNSNCTAQRSGRMKSCYRRCWWSARNQTNPWERKWAVPGKSTRRSVEIP